jgi:hypothetical protein
MLGITLDFDLFASVEFEDGINQAQRAGAHQVVHLNVCRKMRAHFPRNPMEKRQQLYDFLVPLSFAPSFMNGGWNT